MKYNLSYIKSVLSYIRVIPALLGRCPRRGNLILYITNRCNSKCKICNHWQQEPKDLSIWTIHELMHSKTVGTSNWTIEGGEAFCHPDIDRILWMLEKHKVNYVLFTNGILTERIVSAVKKYRIKSVNVSWDGMKETYLRVRGVDGYASTLNTIHILKDITNLQIVFTASPWNSYEDYLDVKDYCDKYKVRLMFNIYSEAAKSGKFTDNLIDVRYENISPYAKYYNKWVRKLVSVPCYSSLFTIPVFPTGDVNLCVSQFIPIGNVYKNSIDEIWNSKEVRRIQKYNIHCNNCWVSCYRNFDVKLAKMKGELK